MQIIGRTVIIQQKLEIDDLHIKLLKDLAKAVKSGKNTVTFKIKDGSIEETITIKHLHDLNKFGLISIDPEDDYYRVVYSEGKKPVIEILEELQ